MRGYDVAQMTVVASSREEGVLARDNADMRFGTALGCQVCLGANVCDGARGGRRSSSLDYNTVY